MARRLWTAIAGILVLGPWAFATRAEAAKPRIAVMAIDADQLEAPVRHKIDAAVAGGLAAAGAEVIDGAATARRLAARGIQGCETSTCRIAIAEATGARYLVRGHVETLGRSYTVRLEMIDGTTGAVIGSREDRCEICTENEAYETVGVTASSLKASVLKRPPGGPKEDGGGAPAVADLGAHRAAKDNPAGLSITAPGSGGAGPPATQEPRFRTLSWIGIAGGAVAVGAGVFLIAINHDLTCDHDPGVLCEFRYKTRVGGIAAITGGALAIAIGSTLLLKRF